jgi:hypothetical protein
MKIKLYVDDIRKCPEGWTLARTNDKAIRLLHTMDVEEISLDHDICWYDRKNKNIQMAEETFHPVAYYLATMPAERRPKKITLHTANPVGGQAMYNTLWRAGIETEILLSKPIYMDEVDIEGVFGDGH